MQRRLPFTDDTKGYVDDASAESQALLSAAELTAIDAPAKPRGAVSKENWLMVGAGYIAGDRFVHYLTSMVVLMSVVRARSVSGLASSSRI
ncbi:hypothetical protein O6R08_06605 [Cutibacterium equinum]|uniref:Uncharacterized protein n=1 Tax=Cutibacterium equinum TaxID=3016342 RepID=A0ABY7QY78_9ACTN|nr:hypothetical protein [Cutibacterium equinum]WCC79217.1 hypothetical protein O6R08_06605 [Cutibacterium equinum]